MLYKRSCHLTFSFIKESLDYIPPSIAVTFDSNSPSSGECVPLNIIDDDITEEQEAFVLSIEALSFSTFVSPELDTATVTIEDDDGGFAYKELQH